MARTATVASYFIKLPSRQATPTTPCVWNTDRMTGLVLITMVQTTVAIIFVHHARHRLPHVVGPVSARLSLGVPEVLPSKSPAHRAGHIPPSFWFKITGKDLPKESKP